MLAHGDVNFSSLLAAIMIFAAAKISGGDYLDDIGAGTMTDEEVVAYIAEFWEVGLYD